MPVLHLIYKDLLLQKRETMVVAILLGIAGASMLKVNPGGTVATMFLIVYLFAVYANAFDFKYNFEATLNSLPVRRSTVVAAKYASVFVMLAVAVVSTFVPVWCLRLAGCLPNVPGLKLVLLALILSTLYYSIYCPLYFELGYMKSRWASFAAMAGVMAAAGVVGGNRSSNSLSDAVRGLSVGEGTPVLLGLAGASMLLLGLSLMVSVRIYRRKEF
jgi:ABC-type transport system involved in multi-copper enzyme maturation permease subunit